MPEDIKGFCTVNVLGGVQKEKKHPVHCTVLYLSLHCTVLYTVLYLHCTVLYIVLYLHCTVLYTVLYFTLYCALHCPVDTVQVWGVEKSTAKLKLLCSLQYSVVCCEHCVLGVASDCTEHSPGWLHLRHHQVWPPLWVQQQETAGQVGGAEDYQVRAILLPHSCTPSCPQPLYYLSSLLPLFWVLHEALCKQCCTVVVCTVLTSTALN